MEIKDFEEGLYNYLLLSDEVKTIESDKRPIGIFMLKERDWIIEPHVVWFPWASARQKIESVTKLLDDIRRKPWDGGFGPEKKTAFIRSSKKDSKFFTHIAKYGILRRIGTSETLGPDGAEALFETKRV